MLLEFELDTINNVIYMMCPGLKGYICSDNEGNTPEPNLNQMKAEKLITASHSHGIRMRNYS